MRPLINDKQKAFTKELNFLQSQINMIDYIDYYVSKYPEIKDNLNRYGLYLMDNYDMTEYQLVIALAERVYNLVKDREEKEAKDESM